MHIKIKDDLLKRRLFVAISTLLALMLILVGCAGKPPQASNESDVENAFTFVVETSAEFANSSISDYLQHGQVTVLGEKGIWLVDNFYENQPDLYNQISKDVTPIVA